MCKILQWVLDIVENARSILLNQDLLIGPTICPFRQLYPELMENLDDFRTHLVESTSEMTQLKVWQLQGNIEDNSNKTLSNLCEVSLQSISLKWTPK